MDVVIIGAGLAGLVTAYELSKHGIRTCILEAQAAAGGRVLTVDYGNGLMAESGMQEIWANNPLKRIAEELDLDLVPNYRHCARSSFRYQGTNRPDIYDGTRRANWARFLSLRERQALEGWLHASRALRARALQHGLVDPDVRALQEISFSDWVTSSAELSDLARTWLKLHLEVELASDWRQFSALYALLEMEVFLDGDVACYAVNGGNSRLIRALVNASGPVTVAARVTSIRRDARDGRSSSMDVSYIKDDKLHCVHARRAVLAVPFHQIHHIDIQPPLSQAHNAALRSLGCGQYAVVHFTMDNDDTAMARRCAKAHDTMLAGGRLGYVYGVVSANDRAAVVCVLVYGEHARAYNGIAATLKVQELLADLEQIQVGFSRHVIDANVYTYHPAAVAVWGPGRSPIDDASNLLRQATDGLYFAGDYTLGGHSDSAVRSGIDVAGQIIDELTPGAAIWSMSAC